MKNSWMLKMYKGMELMKEACHENQEWEMCSACPFQEYCDVLLRNAAGSAPETWDVE